MKTDLNGKKKTQATVNRDVQERSVYDGQTKKRLVE